MPTAVPGTSTNFYQAYSIANYLAPSTGTDYPAQTAAGPNTLTINLANNSMVVDPTTANIQLGIYLGAGKFQYLTLPTGAAQNGGGYWQEWQITQDTSKPVGSQFAIVSVPVPANFGVTPTQPYTIRLNY